MSSTSQGDQRFSHLRKHSKIVSYLGGNFTVHHENLAKLTNSLDAAKFDPVALISVIGPAESGKSLCTNLLIHYFKHDGGGGWMTNLSSVSSKALNIEPLLGFPYGGVSSEDNISTDSDSGIYFWPEPFRVPTYNGNIIVWVLNLHLTEDDRADDSIVELFNVLLNLLSSKIVEIQWKNDGFAFLEARRKLLSLNFPRTMLCNGVVQLCRTSEKPEKVILSEDTEAMEHLQKLIPETLLPSFHGLDFVRVIHIKDDDKPLHNQNGFLVLDAKMHERLDKTIKLIGEFNDINPKLNTSGKDLCMGEVGNYVLTCVKLLNQAMMDHQNNRVLKKPFESCSSYSSPPYSTHPSTNMERNNSKLYPDLRKLYDNSPSAKSTPNASPYEVYGTCRYSVSSYRCEEEFRNKDKTTKVQALRKEKVSNDDGFGRHDAIVEVEAMDVDDDSMDTAAKNVEEEGKEQLKQNEEAKRIFQEESEKKAEALENLQAKLEMEEEQKQMQKEKMEKLAVDACVEIEAGMLKELNYWLNHTLGLSTINECGKMYEQQLLKVKNNIKCREVLGMKRQAKFYKVLQEKTQELRMRFEKIQEFITSFNSSININSKTHGYYTESSFNELIDREFLRIRDKSGISTNEEFMKYAFDACEKLACIYRVQNRNIITQEQFLLGLQCESITDTYNKVMGRIIGESYFNPAQLSRIHSQLIRELIRSLTTAFRFIATEPSQFFKEICEDLLRHLEEEFKPHKIENRLKLEKLQRELSKLLTSSKAVYDGMMDKALRDNCSGLPIQDLKNIHATAVDKSTESLKNGIRVKVGEVKEVLVHVKILQNHIDDAWLSLMEENRVNLRKFQEKRQQQVVDMAQRNDSTQETHSDTKSIFNASQSSPAHSSTYKNATRNGKNNENGNHHPQPKQTACLPPLIFHLSLNHVRLGVHHENEYFSLNPTPAVVGITKDNKWVCGEDTLQEDSTKVWLIRDCFYPWQEKVKIGETTYKITVEFLVGFLFHSLKQKVEEVLNGVLSKAIFIIPFWFSSSQRQQVKDAGSIAGFDETLLINENTAIALHYAINKCKENIEIVVLSENSGHADVTVYTYENLNKQTLKMRGHRGVYDKKDKQKKQSPGVFSLEFWRSFTFGSEVSDSTLQRVKEDYKLAMKQADTFKSKSDKFRSKHILVSWESENWKNTLIQNVEGIMDKKYSTNSQMDDVMAGLGSIGQNPLSVYEIIEDFMNSDIYMKAPRQRETLVKDNNNVIPSDGINFNTDLPCYVSTVCIVQKSNIGDAVIGKLEFHSYLEQGYVKLKVNNEGIISLLSVHPKPKYSNRLRGYTDEPPLSDVQYNWTTPNIKNDDDLIAFASLLMHFDVSKKALVSSKETELAKQNLIGKGQELTGRIENNEGKFRSDLGRSMVKEQIMEALGLLKHPKITTNDIEKQMELFQKLEAKYFPQ